MLGAASVLDVDRIESAYGRARALHGVTLSVGKGEAVALIGANGAGKSTVLRAISGLNPVLSGSIRFEGRDISNQSPRRIVHAGIAHCPEERKIWPDLSVLDHLELGAIASGGVRGDGNLDEVFTLF
ncbi:MAG: ATP-binding cassette domain-containing protein, partial [Methylobacteriaceae bacterium]|nr:ATP-binding cassette domain-containing protein [Methylobacteriaceae bacterium]